MCGNLGYWLVALLACYILCGSRRPLKPAWGFVWWASHPNMHHAYGDGFDVQGLHMTAAPVASTLCGFCHIMCLFNVEGSS